MPFKPNPSDLLTKGFIISVLAEEDKWWSGPGFPKKGPSKWPENKIETKRVLDAEIRKSHQIKEDTKDRKEHSFLQAVNTD